MPVRHSRWTSSAQTCLGLHIDFQALGDSPHHFSLAQRRSSERRTRHRYRLRHLSRCGWARSEIETSLYDPFLCLHRRVCILMTPLESLNHLQPTGRIPLNSSSLAMKGSSWRSLPLTHISLLTRQPKSSQPKLFLLSSHSSLQRISELLQSPSANAA